MHLLELCEGGDDEKSEKIIDDDIDCSAHRFSSDKITSKNAGYFSAINIAG